MSFILTFLRTLFTYRARSSDVGGVIHTQSGMRALPYKIIAETERRAYRPVIILKL